MKALFVCALLLVGYLTPALADYQRNEAVPVDKVIFGKVTSVRNVTQTELLEDRNHGWKVFGGALIGGTIGNQFGSGGGRALSTILGAMLGGSVANTNNQRVEQITLQLVELMITIEDGSEYMVVQDRDPAMIFQPRDKIRMIYLADGSVRIDKQM
ncbi:MAG: glycine zipper 2TM domain-containing protein [Paraglaciecola sp.]|uniref:glycine zipper 2TM domain-containing protein n=1 Tax=Paraglaciecola sp. TaxID=1920173 RepID=UPI00273E1729|nr:glycine zipper 2TM domain-containing protein [Paraglaciecola sp.]MDP5032200.1 glycine zipper 2TM domain-containing protein [Paraglaciecola sp.]MDP5133096.1 glycine zipper 2TM domain-containing protein [Paraglaciecola sp.]